MVHITLQLQSDAANVSGLTNQVAQIIRERDEVSGELHPPFVTVPLLF